MDFTTNYFWIFVCLTYNLISRNEEISFKLRAPKKKKNKLSLL